MTELALERSALVRRGLLLSWATLGLLGPSWGPLTVVVRHVVMVVVQFLTCIKEVDIKIFSVFFVFDRRRSGSVLY